MTWRAGRGGSASTVRRPRQSYRRTAALATPVRTRPLRRIAPFGVRVEQNPLNAAGARSRGVQRVLFDSDPNKSEAARTVRSIAVPPGGPSTGMGAIPRLRAFGAPLGMTA